MKNYLGQALAVATALRVRFAKLPERVVRILLEGLLADSHFLEGSTSNSTPYEVAYVLEVALKRWLGSPAGVSTAIVHESNFYFHGMSPLYKQTADDFLEVKLEQEVVQIELPDIYRNRPIYCAILFHEVGHFVDKHLGLTKYSLLSPKYGVQHENEIVQEISGKHRQEYFADLFAATFIGDSAAKLLEQFIGDSDPSVSHPSTADRTRVIRSFLAGTCCAEVDLVNHSLEKLKREPLKCQYRVPDLSDSFGNVRPYSIKDEDELFGIFEASWMFLLSDPQAKFELWRPLPPRDVERLVNDLVQKSIRNWMVCKRWSHAAT